jgi:hypothetical protein
MRKYLMTRPCELGCGQPAEVYAINPVPGGWGGRYCRQCAESLGLRVIRDLDDLEDDP